VAGSLASIMSLLKIEGGQRQPWDFSAYAPATFAGPARPSSSVIEQADAVSRLSFHGASLRLGPMTAALVPGVSTTTRSPRWSSTRPGWGLSTSPSDGCVSC
jgi:hypothetical protein